MKTVARRRKIIINNNEKKLLEKTPSKSLEIGIFFKARVKKLRRKKTINYWRSKNVLIVMS